MRPDVKLIIVCSLALAACGSPSTGDDAAGAPTTPSTIASGTTEPGSSTSTTSSAFTTTSSRQQPTSTRDDSAATSVPGKRLAPGWSRADVVDVVDGDTLDVHLEEGAADTVRLIGINAPERGECFATEASSGLAGLVAGATVLLEPDQSNRDRFGRLLRYVWTTDDELVNQMVVEAGWALAREYPPDTARSDQLAEAQRRAQDKSVGLWAEDACGLANPADVQIAHIEYDAPGDDNFNLNGEWIEIVNGDDVTVDLTGWMLKDESATHRYRFPDGFVLASGASVRIHTGCGQDTATLLYWCSSGSAVWNNGGDTGFLLDPAGNIVFSYAYG